jgi:hypothetical protein
LLGKVLPTTLQASDSDRGAVTKITLTRVVVWPDGHKDIQGVTPKQLPTPASHALPNSNTPASDTSEKPVVGSFGYPARRRRR